MHKLKKFYEYLDHKTYLNAYNKLISYGQKNRADNILKHANYMKLKSINDKFKFKIQNNPTNINVKFNGYNISKLNDNLLLVINYIDDNGYNYNVSSIIHRDGKIEWFKNNKFGDKKSAINYGFLIKEIYDCDEEMRTMFNKFGVDINKLNVIYRTFYE